MARPGREPNIADVAALAGVSPTTVSRVLNNRGYLSQATKDKVAAAMAELHYRPNEVARALLGQRTRIVGVILPTVSLPFFGEVAVSLEHALAERGYRTLLCNSLGRSEIERDYLLQLEGNRVDGLISGAHSDTIGVRHRRLPVVTIDHWPATSPTCDPTTQWADGWPPVAAAPRLSPSGPVHLDLRPPQPARGGLSRRAGRDRYRTDGRHRAVRHPRAGAHPVDRCRPRRPRRRYRRRLRHR
ncbi:MAG: LacI family DNA-binding transcriptional regulator [Propionibacteriaceae bacterium]|nr:LacI family DNA-binding transcriptional regulator [Propionibacteriaceae bacterium]